MASFNLGRIRGEKGDTGPMGPRGEKGEKGESATIPVFTVGEVHTLPSGEKAHAELIDSDPENIVLNFYIPKGKDGTSAYGDMAAAVYDASGKKTDIYQYAESLVKNVLYKSGGSLTGKIYAHNENSSDMALRNISVSDTFPEITQNGDICILIKKYGNKKLIDCPVGTTLIIEEKGEKAEYIIVAKGYHEKESVTILRKYLLPYVLYYDRSGNFGYVQSSLETHNQLYFFPQLEKKVRENSLEITVTSDAKRNVSIPSSIDFSNMEYFKLTTDKTASIEKNGEKFPYWMANGSNITKTGQVMDADGTAKVKNVTDQHYVRPMLLLNGDMNVEDTVFENQPAVMVEKSKEGIFIAENGEWKECI